MTDANPRVTGITKDDIYADEVAKKREALENVLIPYRTAENEQLLQRHGFRYTDIFYKWYNFCGLVAVKQ